MKQKDMTLADCGVGGITYDLYWLLLVVTGSPPEESFARPMGLVWNAKIEELEEPKQNRLMDICPGGLVTQEFTLDAHPERWNEGCEGSLRIHLIDEKYFERETGLGLEARKASEQGQSTAFVDEPSRPFIEKPGKGIPSVAEMDRTGAKARANPSPSPIPSRMNPEGRVERRVERQAKGEPHVKWTIGKMIRYLFRRRK